MTDARSITLALKGRWHGRYGSACCPAHGDRNASLSLADGQDARLLIKCFAGCEFVAVLDALRSRGLVQSGGVRPLSAAARRTNDEAQQTAGRRRATAAKAVWDETIPVAGSLAEVYLRGRNITSPLPATVRFAPQCRHPGGQHLPAMVALVQGVDGFAVHRTYLQIDSCGKAPVAPPKAMLGSVAGGAVRLTEAQPTTKAPLVVAEGIETALSLASGLLRLPATVWAALSTSGMVGLRLPEVPGRLTIASDGDAAGRGAAHQLATRAHHLGWQVSLLIAPEGQDWNDVLMMHGAVA